MNMAFMMLAVSPSDFTNPDLPLADKLATGGEVALVGVLVVFSVLLILWGSLELFHALFNAVTKKKPAAEKQAVPDQKEAEPISEPEDTVDEAELIAAISAAVAVYTEKAPSSFRVVSFRKIHKNS